MSNYKEILARTIISKGKKEINKKNEIILNKNPNTILGSWVINHLLVVGDNH